MTHEREHAQVRQTWFTELLTTALNDLAHAERVITAFAAQEPDGFIAWGMAEGEATQAHRALRQAPSLQAAAPTDHETVNATADALFELDEVPRRLSGLLADARAADPELAHLVALRALHAFSPEIGIAVRQHETRLMIAVDDGTILRDPEFGGADLLLATAQLVTPGEDGAA